VRDVRDDVMIRTPYRDTERNNEPVKMKRVKGSHHAKTGLSVKVFFTYIDNAGTGKDTP
jgi:hypothetical protein